MIDHLREVAESDEGGVRVVYDSGEEVVAAIDEVIANINPEYEEYGGGSLSDGEWNEGEVRIDGFVLGDVPDSWSSDYFNLVCSTEDGEWGDVQIRICGDPPERHPVSEYRVTSLEPVPRPARGADNEGDVDNTGDTEDTETKTGKQTNSGGANYEWVSETVNSDDQVREEILEQVDERCGSVRATTLERAMMADAVVRYAAHEDVESELWDEFLDEWNDEPVLAEIGNFVAQPSEGGYLGVERFRRLLLDDVGPEIFGEERAEEMFGRSHNTIRDVLIVLRHFHS